MQPLRFATFDIETTGLDASYGRILCACFKFTDEEDVRTVVSRRYKDEPRALRQIHALYKKADVIVTWNGKLFDLPFVNARTMIRRKEAQCPHILDPSKKHIDLMYMSKKLRTRGNRMDGAAKDLAGKNQKYDVEAEEWVRAVDGDRRAFDRIVRHCEVDVVMTEELLEILKPYVVRITR